MANVRLKGGKARKSASQRVMASRCQVSKNYKKLPGSPDIAVTKYKLAIFVDGEFWHGHDWDNRKQS